MNPRKKLSPSLWEKASTLYNTLRSNGEKISRRKFMEALGISDAFARQIIFALENRNIITFSPTTFEAKHKALFIGDLHIPFHDELAIELALKKAEEEGVSQIVILGDLVDFFKISVFRKVTQGPDIEKEIEQARKFLYELRERFPEAEIYYKEGNHEQRLQKYIISNAEHIAGLLDGLLQSKLDLEKLNIRYLVKPFRIGKLWVLHGHEKPRGAYNPEYITNVMWKYIHDHFIVGHYHRSQRNIYKKITGEIFMGLAVGWLGKEVNWCNIDKWNQGFTIVEFNPKGEFRARNYTIYNGEIF